MASQSRSLPFDKYDYYLRAVQSPDLDVRFLRKTYREWTGQNPTLFREDFCAAFALCVEWVKLDKKHRALAIDLDAEPLEYGRNHYLSALEPNQRNRMKVLQQNVLTPLREKADIVAAMNFSYFIFKRREALREYFLSAYRGLKAGGLFFVDCFGGPACHVPNEERRNRGDFFYFWDQQTWDPITHEAHFAIHFQPKKGRKYKNVFSYDWRMWTVPEIRDLMWEVGFRDVAVYWEGSDRQGRGNGVFRRVDRVREEGTEAWICYVVGQR